MTFSTLNFDKLPVIFSLNRKVEEEWIFHYVPCFCHAIACLCKISCLNSLGSIVLIIYSRYISICYYNLYKRILKKTTCLAMWVSLYLIGLLLILLNLAGIGDNSFNRKSLECVWYRMTTYYYTVSFTAIFVWVPLIVTGVFYCQIFFKFRASTKKISHSTSTCISQSPYSWFMRTSPFVGYPTQYTWSPTGMTPFRMRFKCSLRRSRTCIILLIGWFCTTQTRYFAMLSTSWLILTSALKSYPRKIVKLGTNQLFQLFISHTSK